jgi:hypothetical protein
MAVNDAVLYLRSEDAVTCNVINEVGPFTLRPERDRFRMLLRSIISQ